MDSVVPEVHVCLINDGLNCLINSHEQLRVVPTEQLWAVSIEHFSCTGSGAPASSLIDDTLLLYTKTFRSLCWLALAVDGEVTSLHNIQKSVLACTGSGWRGHFTTFRSRGWLALAVDGEVTSLHNIQKWAGLRWQWTERSLNFTTFRSRGWLALAVDREVTSLHNIQNLGLSCDESGRWGLFTSSLRWKRTKRSILLILLHFFFLPLTFKMWPTALCSLVMSGIVATVPVS